MKPDKKQIPQLAVLGLMLLLCIGYVGFQFTGKKAAPPPPAQNQTEQEKKAEELDPEQLRAAQIAGLPAVSKRDPFAPAMKVSDPGQFAGSSKRNGGVDNLPTPNRPVPKIQNNQLASLSQPLRIEPIPVPVDDGLSSEGGSAYVQPSDPDFKVTGVIRGEKNVAIVRVGDERHIIREGQYIYGKYQVVSVKDDGVVLSNEGRRISLKLGGEKNAKQ